MNTKQNTNADLENMSTEQIQAALNELLEKRTELQIMHNMKKLGQTHQILTNRRQIANLKRILSMKTT